MEIILKDTVVALVKVSSRHLPGDTEDGQERPEPGLLVSRRGSNRVTSVVRIKGFTGVTALVEGGRVVYMPTYKRTLISSVFLFHSVKKWL
jgi:hypothetical protein